MANYDKDEEVWRFYRLELHVDPQYRTSIQDLEMDLVTWQLFVLTALKELHGTFGAAIQTDIVQTRGLVAIVRIQREDALTFKSSIVAFNTDLESLGHPGLRANLQIENVAHTYNL